jgi:hypothetical protein
MLMGDSIELAERYRNNSLDDDLSDGYQNANPNYQEQLVTTDIE